MMNTPDLRSPFVERVISLLPRGHEEAMKQAFYNVAAICLFLVMGSAAMAVYFILQPFVKPLLWAVLVGSVIYPLKRKSTIVACNWLTNLQEDDTMLIFGLLAVPFRLLNRGTELLGTALFNHLKLFFFLCCGLHLLQILQTHYHFQDMFTLYDVGVQGWEAITLTVAFLSRPVVLACVVGLFGLCLSKMREGRLYIIMLTLWMIVLFSLLNYLGSWSFILTIPSTALFCVALAINWGWLQEDSDDQTEESVDGEEAIAVDVSTPMPPNGLSRFMRSHIVASAISHWSTPSTTADHKKEATVPSSTSNLYITRALWLCLVVLLSRNMWLFHFVPIPFVFFMLKACGSYFNIWQFLNVYKKSATDSIYQIIGEYKDQIFPMPVQYIYKVIENVFFIRLFRFYVDTISL